MNTFEELAVPHYDYLLNAAVKLCHGDDFEAEDLVQETYLKAYKIFEQYDSGKSSVVTWMYRIMWCAYADTRKYWARHPHTCTSEMDEGQWKEWDAKVQEEFTEFLDRQYVCDMVNTILDASPRDEQEAFKLAMEGASQRQIATQLGVSSPVVNSRVNRVRARMRRALKQYLEASDFQLQPQ